MATPATIDEFLELVRKSGVLDEKRLDAYLDRARAESALPQDPTLLAGVLVRDAFLTNFQSEQLLLGKWRRFTLGNYKVLERLGSGGMGSVYLCEHKFMRRRAAVKVLPAAKSNDPAALERFYREARAVAALDHPNIVRAYDIDQEDNLHFLVMEYVDGASLQEIIKRTGPLDPLRAAHYVRQAAFGLQHAHETAGLVHRDIKPGNILVDRTGLVKVLDMGLARFFHDEEDLLTKKYDENVLGTADYLAPEQALDSHSVDIRADIYGLGATFYFCLTGRTPFCEGTVAQKLIWHQTRQPKSIRSLRPEVPEELVAVLEKMMAKDPDQRYQLPQEVADALATWTETLIPPPPEAEMPRLSPAAMGMMPSTEGPAASSAASGPLSSRKSKVWQVPATPTPRPAAVPAPMKTPQPPSGPSAPLPRTPLPQKIREARKGNGSVAIVPPGTPAAMANSNGTTKVSKRPQADQEEEGGTYAPVTADAERREAPAPRPAPRASRPAARPTPPRKKQRQTESENRWLNWLLVGGALLLLLGLGALMGWLFFWSKPGAVKRAHSAIVWPIKVSAMPRLPF